MPDLLWIEVLESSTAVGGKPGDVRQLVASRAEEFARLGLVRILPADEAEKTAARNTAKAKIKRPVKRSEFATEREPDEPEREDQGDE